MQLFMLCKVENVSLTNRFYAQLFGPDAVEAADDGIRLFIADWEIDFFPRNPEKPRIEQPTYPGFILAVSDTGVLDDFRMRLENLQSSFHYDADDAILTFTDPDGYAWQVYVDETAAEEPVEDEFDAEGSPPEE